MELLIIFYNKIKVINPFFTMVHPLKFKLHGSWAILDYSLQMNIPIHLNSGIWISQGKGNRIKLFFFFITLRGLTK